MCSQWHTFYGQTAQSKGESSKFFFQETLNFPFSLEIFSQCFPITNGTQKVHFIPLIANNNSPESNANNATRDAIRVRNFVLSSRGICPDDRFPSGQMLFLKKRSRNEALINRLTRQTITYSIVLNRCSILSTSINALAAWIIFLLAVWLTHGAPNKRLMIPRLNHCDLACKSNTSSNKFRADVSAGYSDDCWEMKIRISEIVAKMTIWFSVYL